MSKRTPEGPPLKGRRVVVTRARAQAGELLERLAGLGAEPLLVPAIRTVPADPAPLRAAARDTFDWLVFTSANGVAAFWPYLEEHGVPAVTRVAAIGPATAEALTARGVAVAFVPETHVAEALAAGLPAVDGRRVLLPQADRARPTLADGLRRRGAVVTTVVAYHTVPDALGPAALARLRGGVDAVTFTSASTVQHFLDALGDDAEPLLHGALVACIGPVTAEAAEACGLHVGLVAAPHTLDGLVEGLVRHFTRMQVAGPVPS